MKYSVTYSMTARFSVEVEANSLEEAKTKADTAFSEADFGPAKDIDGEINVVEDESGNNIWVR